MPAESSLTGLVTTREITLAIASTTPSASRNTPTILSRMDTSESTVSCTLESWMSTPWASPASSSGAVKHPTQTRLTSRPVIRSNTDGVCCTPAPSCRWKP